MGDPRQHVHELIDRLPPVQLSALAALLESMVEQDPVAEAIRTAPLDDEPESEEEKQAVQEARDWLAQNGGKGIPHEEVLAELGLTAETFARMGQRRAERRRG
jgi:hypothetical protein